MRLKIAFEWDEQVFIPFSYNHFVQSFIYTNLDRSIAEPLHDTGIPLGKRRFKFFTFSRLFSPSIKRNGKGWLFKPPLSLYLSARDIHLLESFAIHLVKTEKVRIGRSDIRVKSIEVIKPPDYSEEMIIKPLSPITVYSTLLTAEGKKKTYYYTPFEKEFESLLRDNLRRKFKAIYGVEPQEEDDIFEIEPYKVNKNSEVIVKFKGFVIKGWMGLYKVKMSKPYFEIAYDSGLGPKNSQGFGMIEVVRKRR